MDFFTPVIICPQLVLRKWSELIPGGEFRCFVKENKLIGKDPPLTLTGIISEMSLTKDTIASLSYFTL